MYTFDEGKPLSNLTWHLCFDGVPQPPPPVDAKISCQAVFRIDKTPETSGIYIPVVPGQAGGGSFHSIKKHKPIRTRWPIEKNNHPTEFLPFPRLLRAGFFFFFGQAQQGHRHVLRHSDATKPMRSPQRRTHCRETAFFAVRMRHASTRGPQRRASCRETTFWDIRMRRRQCAAHSGTRTAEQRNRFIHGCPMSNATKV